MERQSEFLLHNGREPVTDLSGSMTDARRYLGSLQSDKPAVTAGSWQEIRLTYSVGHAGLASGGSFRIILRSDSDWADLQTGEPQGDNCLTVEVALSPLSSSNRLLPLLVARYDVTEEQKWIQVTVVDGTLVPGDIVQLRLGDRRFGGRGTRVQTFAEERFLWRMVVDVDGKSGEVEIDSVPELAVTAGPASMVRIIAAPAARTGVAVPVLLRVEDLWGNVTAGVSQRASLEVCDPAGRTAVSHFEWDQAPWSVHRVNLSFDMPGEYQLRARSETCTAEFVILAQEAADPGRPQSVHSAPWQLFPSHPDSGANAQPLHLA
jgi:hypothetical protein